MTQSKLYRADGRHWPVGTHANWTAVGQTTDENVLAAAPPSPTRILIQSITLSVVSWTGPTTSVEALKVASITATVMAKVVGLLIVGAAHGGDSITLAPPGGILCDVGTKVFVNGRSTEKNPYAYATITYDIVT